MAPVNVNVQSIAEKGEGVKHVGLPDRPASGIEQSRSSTSLARTCFAQIPDVQYNAINLYSKESLECAERVARQFFALR